MNKVGRWISRHMTTIGSLAFLAFAVWRTAYEARGGKFPGDISFLAMVGFMVCMADATGHARTKSPMKRHRHVIFFSVAMIALVLIGTVEQRTMSHGQIVAMSDAGVVLMGASLLVLSIDAERRQKLSDSEQAGPAVD